MVVGKREVVVVLRIVGCFGTLQGRKLIAQTSIRRFDEVMVVVAVVRAVALKFLFQN